MSVNVSTLKKKKGYDVIPQANRKPVGFAPLGRLGSAHRKRGFIPEVLDVNEQKSGYDVT